MWLTVAPGTGAGEIEARRGAALVENRDYDDSYCTLRCVSIRASGCAQI